MKRTHLLPFLPIAALVCGVIGVLTYLSPRSAHAATAAQATAIRCQTAAPCAQIRNDGTGIAADSRARNNSGVHGSTAALNAPYGKMNGLTFPLLAGVVGEDLVTNSLADGNVGLLGLSKTSIGVAGFTFNTCNCGAGSDVTTFLANPAVFGEDVGPSNGLGGPTNVGVLGRSLSRVGGLFLARSGYGAVGRTFTGTGVLGVSRAAGGVALAATSLLGGPIFQGFDATREVASIDSAGNLVLAGSVHTGSAPTVVTQTPSGSRTATYLARQSMATVEDFGRATVRSGSAQIQLDPAFAALMDQRSDYMVFITAEGNNRGLYVGNRTAAGFSVREIQGARDTVPFSYRIVTHAYGSHEARLSVVPEMPITKRPAGIGSTRDSVASARDISE